MAHYGTQLTKQTQPATLEHRMKPITPTRHLNIALFTDTYEPQINGVVTSTNTLVHELNKHGHKTVIMCPKTSEDQHSNASIWRFRSMPFPFQTEHRITSPLSRKLQNFKDLNIDIIHIQTPFLMGHLGLYLAWKHDIPVVHTYHTFWEEYLHYFPLVPKRLRKLVSERLLSKKFCNRCEHIIVPSKQMYSKLLEYGVSSPISIIPTGIVFPPTPTALQVEAFKEKWKLPQHNKVLVFVGRLGTEKNVYFLLEAFEKVKQNYSNLTLLIVGDGPEKESMQDLILQKKLSDSVVFTGYVPHEEVYVAYRAADVIAFPSKTETQGLSLIEGLLMGKPTVCLNALGVKDILTPEQVGGFLVNDDVSAFSGALLQLLTDNGLYQEKSHQALMRAHSYSSIEMAQRHQVVYEATKIEHESKQ